jgi:hypothetical protein
VSGAMSVQQIRTIEAFAAVWASVISLILMRFEMATEMVLPLICSAA